MPQPTSRTSGAEPRVPAMEESHVAPRDESCWGCNTVTEYWGIAKDSARNLVDSNPLLAIITAVVFAIFGISQILPTVVSAIIIAVPLCSFAYMIAQDIILNREAFTRSLILQLAKTNAKNAVLEIEMGRRAPQMDKAGVGAVPDSGDAEHVSSYQAAEEIDSVAAYMQKYPNVLGGRR